MVTLKNSLPAKHCRVITSPGCYYPDKTRVGWWKNGYPEYFAKVLNAANWIGINIDVEYESLDLNHCEVRNFRRVLNMQEGYLERSFIAVLKSGKELQVNAKRFCSIVDDEAGAIRYAITPLNFDGKNYGHALYRRRYPE